jgi:hypothetical protein
MRQQAGAQTSELDRDRPCYRPRPLQTCLAEIFALVLVGLCEAIRGQGAMRRSSAGPLAPTGPTRRAYALA